MKILLVISFLIVAMTLSLSSGEGYRDPLVRISILPNDVNVEEFLPKLSKDISDASGVPESGITVIWNEVPAGRMITGGKLGVRNEDNNHPVVVELNLAGFFTREEVEKTMAGIADSFERHTNIERNQVFIVTTLQTSGMVYVFGKALEWEDGENPFEGVDEE